MKVGGIEWIVLYPISYLGCRDIAEILLKRCARVELRAAAMLGQVDLVRAVLAANPGQRDVRSPVLAAQFIRVNLGRKQAVVHSQSIAQRTTRGSAISYVEQAHTIRGSSESR